MTKRDFTAKHLHRFTTNKCEVCGKSQNETPKTIKKIIPISDLEQEIINEMS